MMMKQRILAGRLLLIFFSALVGVIAAEVGLRVWTGLTTRSGPGLEEGLERSESKSPDPDAETTSLRGLVRASTSADLVYELKPDLDCTFKGARVRTNSYGMRNRECSVEKHAGIIRVAGLGDSVMFGWGVAEEDSYLRVLEHQLDEAANGSLEVQVLNFAVPGYNTAMEVEAFREKALEFSPDLVILHFVKNDLGLPRFMINAPNPWSLRRSWLVDLVRDGWRGARGGSRQWHEPHHLNRLSPEGRERVRDSYAHLAGPEAFRSALASLAELTRSHSIPVVFVLLQTDGEPHAMASAAAERHGFSLVIAGPFFAGYIRDNGIEPTRDGWADTFWLSRKDRHPNELGHRLIADAVFETILPLMADRAAGAYPGGLAPQESGAGHPPEEGGQVD